MKTNNKLMAMLLVAGMFAFCAAVVVSDSEDSDAATEVTSFAELKAQIEVTSGTFDVKLGSDIVVESTLKTTVDGKIDLNGHNLTATEDAAVNDKRILQVKSGEVEITGQGSIIANKGGSTWSDSGSVIRVGDGVANAPSAKLIVGAGVMVSSDNSYGISVFNGKSGSTPEGAVTLIIYGTVAVSGTATAISGVGNSYNGTTYIEIKDGAMVSSTQDNAIYFPCSGSLSIDGAVIGYGGVEVKAGNGDLQIGENASITATGTKSHTPSGNGTSTKGFAIAVCENGGYKGDAKFTISGGIVLGDIALLRDTTSCEKDATLTITGGMIDGKIWKKFNGDEYDPTGTITVTGGVFSTDPSAFVPSGYESKLVSGLYYVGEPGSDDDTVVVEEEEMTEDGVTVTTDAEIKVDSEGNVKSATVTVTTNTGSEATARINSSGSTTLVSNTKENVVLADKALQTIALLSMSASASDVVTLNVVASGSTVSLGCTASDMLDDGLLNLSVTLNSGSSSQVTIALNKNSLEPETAYMLSVEGNSAKASALTSAGLTGLTPFNLGLYVDDVETELSGSVTVSIPVQGEFDNMRLYCLDTRQFFDVVYSNGVVSATLPHFSTWAIVYDKPVVVVDDDDDILFILEQQKKAQEAASAQTTSSDSSGEEAAVIIAAAAVAGAMLACAFFAFRRP